VKPFRYERPADVGEAIALLERGDGQARFLGGGTNLVDLMKLGVEEPEVLVDVNRLGLDGITRTPDGELRIGAGVRNSDLAAHPLVRHGYPMLSEALLAGASGQLRNMATVGGNLLQRTRCRYFQDVTAPCNKRDPGSGCPAIEGEHHNLAILGSSPACIATHPSDMAVALAALDAEVHVQGADGTREIPFEHFHRLPDDRPDVDTTLAPGELIVAVELPPPVERRRSRYRKVRERASFAFAVASVAAEVYVDSEGTLLEVKLALGAVAHKPWRARTAEAELRGARADARAFRRAIDHELEAARPLRDNAYKVSLVRNLLTSVLCELTGADPDGAR
jgi:xanthine dehydrogenase YagS FAD-binding subunit